MERTGVVCPSVYGLSAELPAKNRLVFVGGLDEGSFFCDLDIALTFAFNARSGIPAARLDDFTIVAVFAFYLGHQIISLGRSGRKRKIGGVPGASVTGRKVTSKSSTGTPHISAPSPRRNSGAASS